GPQLAELANDLRRADRRADRLTERIAAHISHRPQSEREAVLRARSVGVLRRLRGHLASLGSGTGASAAPFGKNLTPVPVSLLDDGPGNRTTPGGITDGSREESRSARSPDATGSGSVDGRTPARRAIGASRRPPT